MKAAGAFLWIVAALVLLVLVSALLWTVAGERMLRWAMVPRVAFVDPLPAQAPDFARPDAWIVRGSTGPAAQAPPGFRAAPAPPAAVFHLAPTAWLSRTQWNAPLSEPEYDERLRRFVATGATPFHSVGEVWSPRYRQATFGAFLQPSAAAERALALAYDDSRRAFRAFVAAQPPDRPLILVGHSQGARHLLRLLRDDVREPALQARIVAVYAAGWPVLPGVDERLAGMPLCRAAGETGCILSWQSWAADGDLAAARLQLAGVRDLAGMPIGARAMGCVNPLLGAPGAAPPQRHLGAWLGDDFRAGTIGARCEPGGLLLLDPPPGRLGPYMLPGGNAHVYDIPLFWANLRADAEARLAAWQAGGPGPPRR